MELMRGVDQWKLNHGPIRDTTNDLQFYSSSVAPATYTTATNVANQPG